MRRKKMFVSAGVIMSFFGMKSHNKRYVGHVHAVLLFYFFSIRPLLG
jgi:hypothetical protein